MNTEEKKLTGYPSVDKPWLKYYTEEAEQLNSKNIFVRKGLDR